MDLFGKLFRKSEHKRVDSFSFDEQACPELISEYIENIEIAEQAQKENDVKKNNRAATKVWNIAMEIDVKHPELRDEFCKLLYHPNPRVRSCAAFHIPKMDCDRKHRLAALDEVMRISKEESGIKGYGAEIWLNTWFFEHPEDNVHNVKVKYPYSQKRFEGTGARTFKQEWEEKQKGKQKDLALEISVKETKELKSVSDLKKQLDKFGLAVYYKKLGHLARNSIHMELTPVSEDELGLGVSKIGGHPDLPRSVDWFTNADDGVPLSLICQINLAEIKSFDVDNELPEKGILYFFYDSEAQPWGFDPKDASGTKVYYFDGDESELERKEDTEAFVFECASLNFRNEYELPSLDSDHATGMNFSEEVIYDLYYDYCSSKSEPINKLLGHSDIIQNGMEIECELVTNGLYCGDATGYNDERAKELKKNYAKWRLLMQIDTNDDVDMMWGDCGRLYLWITEDDLKNKNFEKSWLILQCG